MGDRVTLCELPDGRITLGLDADLPNFEAARLRLRAFLERGEASERAIYRSELVFEEVCVNVIRHAYAGRRAGSRPIHAEVRIADDDIILTIEDEGPPFDPTAAPSHTPATSLDEARTGGRGIALTRLWTRQMTYARSGDRNRVTLIVARR